MSDIEHEFVVENEALRQEIERVRALAVRAITTAIEAQDAATGTHDAWLDSALEDLAVVDV